jgi:hypothetical protein
MAQHCLKAEGIFKPRAHMLPDIDDHFGRTCHTRPGRPRRLRQRSEHISTQPFPTHHLGVKNARIPVSFFLARFTGGSTA